MVFLGDEITELWAGAARILPGQAVPESRNRAARPRAQMLVRFRQDVIALKPKVVVIQAGMNDLLVRSTEGMMADNFMSMVDIAKVQRYPRGAGVGDSGLRLLHEADGAPPAGQDHRPERLDQGFRGAAAGQCI